MRRVLLWVSLALAFCVSMAHAQDGTSLYITPETEGVTWCDPGQPARSFIDAAFVGSDSLEEVVVHEKVHRAQFNERLQKTGSCYARTAEEQLGDEIEAYCASGKVRVRHHHGKKEVNDGIERILVSQFWTKLSPGVVIDGWRWGC